MPRNQLLLLLLTLSVLEGCADMSVAEQNDLCQSQLAETPAMLLIGTDGLSDVCACTVDSLAVRFPDAGARWLAYQTELDDRLESRGVLGMVLDTAWANSRGKEIGEFAGAQAEIVAACTARLLPR